MKYNAIGNRLIMIIASLAICAALLPATTYAYNRGRANIYALDWSGWDEYGQPKRNTAIYHDYQLDCANFVSQCLIAGGIRFRHCASELDNIQPTEGSEWGGTGVNTKAIKDSNTGLYSRVVSGREELWGTLTLPNGYHKGVAYTESSSFNSADFWNRVERGDTCFQLIDGVIWHSMFVSTVVKTGDPATSDLKTCAHTAQRHDEALMPDVGDWKNNGNIYVCLLRDAPMVVPEVTRVFYSTTPDDYVPIRWYWWDKHHVRGVGIQDRYRAGRLDVQITFDTLMDVSNPGSFRLKVPTSPTTYNILAFAGLNGGGWVDGWWTLDDDDEAKQYYHRTWRGKITSGIPNVRNTLATVIVNAVADDGSVNDKDNDLSKYVEGDFGGIKICIDNLGGRSRP